jgi:hypothetical protein
MRLDIKCGVLIIGSLFWDGNNNQRKRWHSTKLLMSNLIHVKAPIRYGRLSGDKPKHYTMVFSKDAEFKNELGTAYLIPFRNTKIAYLKGLRNQAEFLSFSENKKDSKIVKGKKEKWCTIGLIINPNLSSEKKEFVLTKWGEIIKEQGKKEYYKEYKIGKEKSILSERGEILINWIKAVDNKKQKQVNEFDVILATCTKPTEHKYPDKEEMIINITEDKRQYFYNNIQNGISTFIDNKIINKVVEKKKK